MGLADRPAVGMPVDPQHPVDVRRDLPGYFLQRGDHRIELGLGRLAELGTAGGEQDFRLETKRSPTMWISARSPMISRKRPKNSNGSAPAPAPCSPARY
jgi:hypothetical protein